MSFQSELRLTLGQAKEGVNREDVTVDWYRWWLQGYVVGKFELSADCDDAPDNVSSINAAAVPGVGCALGCLHENLVRISVICCNRDSLIEEPEKSSHAHCFVVAACCGVEAKYQHHAHLFEHAEEGTRCIIDLEAAEADLQ